MKILQDIFPAVISMTKTEPTSNAPLAASNPASVLKASKVDRARVIVTGEPRPRIIVAVDSPTGPLVIFNQAYDPSTATRARNKDQDSFLTTTPDPSSNDQPIYVAYARYQDCSCGSRLRGWNPFNTVTSSLSIREPNE